MWSVRVAGILALGAVLVSSGCAPAVAPARDVTECGAPVPGPQVDHSLLPKAFVPRRALVIDTRHTNQALDAVLVAPLSVQEALAFYGEAVASEGYEVVSEDNEGFEAELYMRRAGELGGVGIRPTLCNHMALIQITLHGPA